MFDLKKAAQVQLRLSARLDLRPLRGSISLVGGVDCGYDLVRQRIRAAAVVLSYPELQTIATAQSETELRLPYIPGYLNFREGPAVIRALRSLSMLPDVTLIDGNGIAHPRRMGLASYVGVTLGICTIGCAKNPFYAFQEPGPEKGAATPYYDDHQQRVGKCLRTRRGVKPLFVSPGNRIDTRGAIRIVVNCSRTRIPEPLRRAHRLASQNPD
jgi:deoxyribonuclease V